MKPKNNDNWNCTSYNNCDDNNNKNILIKIIVIVIIIITKMINSSNISNVAEKTL